MSYARKGEAGEGRNDTANHMRRVVMKSLISGVRKPVTIKKIPYGTSGL
jgi:hypothetical protein